MYGQSRHIVGHHVARGLHHVYLRSVPHLHGKLPATPEAADDHKKSIIRPQLLLYPQLEDNTLFLLL